MKSYAGLIAMFLPCALALAQTAPQPKSVTVPITLDHNRVVIDVDLPLPDGSTQRVHGWVDSGNPALELSRRVATLMNLNVICDDKSCSAPPPREITIGGMKISLATIKQADIPLKPVSAAAVLASGMNVEINIPSSVLHHYDVLVNFPDHKFTIAQPGTLKFQGSSGKVLVNQENGLVQVPSQIENKKYNLALDVGSSISFFSPELFERLQNVHPDWPHMTGAVGPANMWGMDTEPKWNLLRVDRVQYGSLFLTSVAVTELPKEWLAFFEKRAGAPTAGLLGANALLNYRVGIDYAHSTVYFDLGTTFKASDFDVVGLILRPEDDGRYTILSVADFDGKPSVSGGQDGAQPGDHLVAVDITPVPGSTMGQVWSLLQGQPGQERKLTLERGGKQFTVVAKVQHFLGETQEKERNKEGKRRTRRF